MSDPIRNDGGPKRSGALHISRKMAKVAAWTAGSLLLLIVLLAAGVTWYTTTADFQRRVKKELISTLEDATGGRVELGSISLNLWHLAVEVNGLVVHGLEGPGEAPYLLYYNLMVSS